MPPFGPSSRYAKVTPPAVTVRVGASAYEVTTDSSGLAVLFMMIFSWLAYEVNRRRRSVGEGDDGFAADAAVGQ
jgi:hypothetical protein